MGGILSALSDRILGLSGVVVYLVVGGLVFAEDAIFVGFVLPGETAAVLGGVMASRGHVHLSIMLAVVVLAAIVGDTVGYEVGKHVGPRLLQIGPLRGHAHRLDDAQRFLARRGGSAVFLGRFVAFFRAVMPALAGISRMHYPKFLAYNAVGGLVWGVGFVMIGFLAGNSYAKVEKTVGRGAAIAVAVVVVLALIAWRVHKARAERRSEQEPGDEPAREGDEAERR
ncbi:MAG: DedA family protein [Motilibacteraceae bacterium]